MSEVPLYSTKRCILKPEKPTRTQASEQALGTEISRLEALLAAALSENAVLEQSVAALCAREDRALQGSKELAPREEETPEP